MNPADLLIRYGGAFSPGVVRSASGSFLELEDGSRVLDFTAGQICATIGHSHPRVVEAIERACREVMHLNSWSLSPPVLSLAERLVATLPAPLERTMFLSTGAEANEAALRMSKLFSGGFEVAALTRSEKGAVVIAGEEVHVVDAAPVAKVVDTTGAGDLYAAGFLFGYTRGLPLDQCSRIGAIAAAEVIGHFGARPETSLADLVAARLGPLPAAAASRANV